MSRVRITAVIAAAAVPATLLVSAAWAYTPQEGLDTVYAGAGSQYGNWSLSGQKLRLKVFPGSGMSTSKCMDAFLDWGTEGDHYDGRVIRSCRPGTTEETDPGGNGFWSEPTDFAGAHVNGIQKGFGYMIDDGNLQVLTGAQRMANTGSGSLDNYAPGTGTQGYARVRTRYQDGTVKSCNPLPVTSPSGSGGCS